METQSAWFAHRTARTRYGEVLPVERRAGELAVVSGRVWLTRRGHLVDDVLGAGEQVVLEPGDQALFEQFERGESALVEWRPYRRSAVQMRRLTGLARGAATLGWGALAAGAAAVAEVLRDAEAGFAALARRAACSARRAQGCISPGDSMASSGALK